MTSYVPLLEIIANEKIPTEFIQELPPSVVNFVSEICFNLLYGEVPLSEQNISELSLVKDKLLRLSNPTTSLRARRGLIDAALLRTVLKPLQWQSGLQ